MKVLVTGASGFIGSHLVPRLLQAGHSVRTFGRSHSAPGQFAELAIEHVSGDIADPVAVDAAVQGMDMVFHMAGLVSYRKSDTKRQRECNVVGTTNVMQSALKHAVKRVIHTSSVAALGIPPAGEIGDESIVYNLEGRGLNYCDTKHEAELEVLKYVKQGLSAVMLCPGIIFGEGDTHPHHHAIYGIMLKGKLVGWPEGGVTFSDIDDVVNAHLNAMTMGKSGERYILGSACLSYREAALVLCKVVGTPAPKFRIPKYFVEFAGIACEAIFPLMGKRPPLTYQIAWLSQQNIYFQSDKAIAELDFKQTPFEGTINRTLPYYLAQHKTLLANRNPS